MQSFQKFFWRLHFSAFYLIEIFSCDTRSHRQPALWDTVTLEFAGESEPVFERDKNNRRVLARRSYNLYSDVQKGENVVVEIPVQAGEKKFKYEQKVKLVNPKLYGRGYAIGDMGHTDYVLLADDIVAVEEK